MDKQNYYRKGYIVASITESLGQIIVVIGLLVAFFAWAAGNFRIFSFSLLVGLPGVWLALFGLSLVLIGQLARAFFDLSQAVQSLVREKRGGQAPSDGAFLD